MRVSFDLEGDFGGARAVAIDPPDLAARPEDDGVAVRGPGHVGIDAVHRPGLLQILVERAIDLTLLARAQILDEEMAMAAGAVDIGEPAPVRRGRRPHRAAGPARDPGALAGRHVVALDREHLLVRILGILEGVAGGGVAAEEDRAAVGGESRLAQFLLILRVGPLDQRHAVADAADMVEPDLAGAERALRREMLARGDILAVAAPGRRVEQAESLVGDLARAAAVDVHHPDIVAAAAVRGEGDEPAIGREARLHVEGEARGDPGRMPAGDRHGVDVAEQVEGDRPPVRADVDVHPGAFVHVELDLAQGRARRRVDVPGRGIVRRPRGRGERAGGDEQKRKRGEAAEHERETPGIESMRNARTVHYPSKTGNAVVLGVGEWGSDWGRVAWGIAQSSSRT